MVVTTAVLLACCVAVPELWAHGPGPQGSGLLVPVSDLNVPSGTPASQPLGPAFVPAGSDPLQNGTVEFSPDGTVHVNLHGASANQTYSAYFCRFGFGPAGCVLVGQTGALSTDASGNGQANLDFPATQVSESLAGLVLITRTITSATTYEYAGAIQLRASPAAQARFDIQGQISSIDAAAASFVISPLKETITTDASTKFQGKASSFPDLMVGMQVDVRGVVNSDGTLLATDVTAN